MGSRLMAAWAAHRCEDGFRSRRVPACGEGGMWSHGAGAMVRREAASLAAIVRTSAQARRNISTRGRCWAAPEPSQARTERDRRDEP